MTEDRQRPFDELYNSKNVEEIAGKSFGLLAVSAMPAAKWIANRDPDGDRAVLDRLTGCLRRLRRAGRRVAARPRSATCQQSCDREDGRERHRPR